MIIHSDNVPRREGCAQGGNGIARFKDLSNKEGLYGHGRLFSHIVLDPGCSIGYHEHQHETEWYYLLKGEAVYNDNGVEVPMHAGDLSITPHGEGHALENRSTEPVELIALIVMK